MKTAIRSIILLCIVLWLGGILFFPIVAATAFTYLPDTHAAGTIVGHCLRILHYEGLISGTLIVLLLLLAQAVRAVPRSVIVPVVLTLIMLGFTAYSQFSVIPQMERDRIAAGGVIDAVPPNNPYRMDFNRLHGRSENVEMVVLLAGVVLVVLLAANYPKEEKKA
ncbi:MAG TPA: DUF4149 domain-containing protein [Acidobacteriaceae bacterium]|nr:DUF4149 domain-containing protein [Acidobacteriaceae bacterium]